VLVNVNDRMINRTHRYVATAICPIGKNEAGCVALAEHIFADEAAAAAGLVDHLASDCHTQEQLARVVGAVKTHVKSFRLVYDRGATTGLPRPSSTERTAGLPQN
jgi:hypothetical protein